MNISFAQAVSRKDPLLLSEVKEHIGVQHTEDDAYLRSILRAATRRAESYTGRKFVNETITLDLDAQEAIAAFYLPYAPLSSLTSFVTYTSDSDTTGTAVPATNYRVDGDNPARVVAIDGGWNLYRAYKAARLVYVAGYGSSGEDVPDDLLHAIKVLCADMYMNQESAKLETRTQLNANLLPTAARTLLQPYIVHVW